MLKGGKNFLVSSSLFVLSIIVRVNSFSLEDLMGLMAKAYRERKICIDKMRQKYPGLPYYEKEHVEIFRTIAFGPIYDSTICPLSPYESPKKETIKKAEELEEIYKANSKLSSRIGYFLDYLYTKEEAEYYSENIEEFINLNAVFKGSMHTIGYISYALKKQNYTNSYCEIYGDLYFECWREELDTSDKYNPYMKKVTYKERVTPISKALFLKELERRLKL